MGKQGTKMNGKIRTRSVPREDGINGFVRLVFGNGFQFLHFSIHPDPDIGNGYGGLVAFTDSKYNNIRIHKNVFEGVPGYCIHGLCGDDIRINNNTIRSGLTSQVPNHWRGSPPQFINTTPLVSRAGWDVVAIVIECEADRPGEFWNIGSAPTPTDARVATNVMWNATAGVSDIFWAVSSNIKPVTADPIFTDSGAKPFPFFISATRSPLLETGTVIPQITDGFSGFRPDIGPYEVILPNVVTLAGEGFESSSWAGGTGWTDSSWTQAGKCTLSAGATSAYAGSCTAQIAGTGASLTRGLNLTGRTGINIEVAVRTELFESTDKAYIDFYNGQTWSTLLTITGNKN